MRNNKDDIKTFIVIMCVCVICVVLVLILNIKSNIDKMAPVNEYNVFFSNVNYVNNYINYISSNDNVGVFSLLDKEYILENDITYDNVLDTVKSYSIGSSLKVTSMDFVQVKDNFIYYVKGKIYKTTYDSEVLVDDNFSIIVISDSNNLSYSLYPVNDDYEKKINSIKKISIENNGYNSITKSDLINKEQICVIYLSDFLGLLSNDINEAYDLLSDDMKKIYTTSDSFNNYIRNNFNLFSSIADKCRVDKTDDKRVYTVIDDNQNTYVFTEESIMNYNVDFNLKKVSE